jgi:uncharacterized protein (TIGR03435 family)
MRLFLLSVLASALAAPLPAQTALGNWQGTLQDNPAPRIILSLSKLPDGSVRALLYKPERWGNSNIPVKSVQIDGPHVKLDVGFYEMRFDGTVAPDGKTLTGTWSEDKKTYPLILRLAALDDLWIKPGSNVHAMDPHADPSFEVATIKPSAPDAKGLRFHRRTHNFQAKNATLSDIISLAFDLRERQIENAPEWFKSDHFDIDAIADTPGDPSEEQDSIMLRKLLADRFGLKFHMVKKDFPVLALRADKKPAALQPPSLDQLRIITSADPDGTISVMFQHTSMAALCETLMGFIPQRQVIDETGIAGFYDFTAHLPAGFFEMTDKDEANSLAVDAVKALGFRLEPTHAQLDVMIIDHIDKPSPN